MTLTPLLGPPITLPIRVESSLVHGKHSDVGLCLVSSCLVSLVNALESALQPWLSSLAVPHGQLYEQQMQQETDARPCPPDVYSLNLG